MRFVIYAVLIYVAYLVVKSILRLISSKEQQKVHDRAKEKPKRSYDLNQAEDAQFREVKKE